VSAGVLPRFTTCLGTIVLDQQLGFDNLTAAEVVAAKGQFTAPHPKYY
jgi:hypothetical protein